MLWLKHENDDLEVASKLFSLSTVLIKKISSSYMHKPC